MTMTAEQKIDEQERILDTPMNKQFNWSTDVIPVRDAIWNYYMEHDGKNTMVTEAKVHPYLNMSNKEVAQHAEELLKP